VAEFVKDNNPHKDDFESVAKRLGCNPDLKEFDKKLGKIVKSNKGKKKK
jgi:hypothetical protein